MSRSVAAGSIQRMTMMAAGALIAAALVLKGQFMSAAEPDRLRVMTFNLWHGGEAGGQPWEQSAEVIKAARADVVGLQETGGLERNGKTPDNARRIAEMLSWQCVDQGGGTAVISRHEIVGKTDEKWGVKLRLPSDHTVWVFNAHFAHAPYQPYQLLSIPYEDGKFITTAEDAVVEARQARGHEVARMLEEIRGMVVEPTPIFVTGDFNEPSALDWTQEVVQARRCPVAVEWPTTKAVLDAGFIDAFRQLHADPLRWPGYTWTTTTREDDPRDHHDRIDFVLVGGVGSSIESAQIVGERPERADIVVTPYPSDHRAVVVETRIAP